jgi:hypothetical protein
MKFYLGTNEPRWLERTATPLFISRRRMGRVESRLPHAACPWALDSGGFSELMLFGGWRTSPKIYAREVARYRDEIGKLEWACVQDWICDPRVRKKTKSDTPAKGGGLVDVTASKAVGLNQVDL